jgi:DNA-binding NtrC family response regulator
MNATMDSATPLNATRLGGMLTASDRVRTLFERVARLAGSPLPVLVLGPTGAGKELVARAIHEKSGKADGPFLAVNCGALSESLIEGELFGYVKGAFTGAATDKKGVFEEADGGTLFLDEVGELPLELQPKLLRVLETLSVRRVGGNKEIRVDVRVVTATHRDLRAMVKAGKFREDLYHRLAILTLKLPTLAERPEDIELLAHWFVAEETRGTRTLSAAAIGKLLAYRWPGNVRELKNVVLRAALMSDDVVIGADAVEIPEASIVGKMPEISRVIPFPSAQTTPAPSVPLKPSLNCMTLEEERKLLVTTLQACGNNRSRAARRLGIPRSTLHDRLEKLGVPLKFPTMRDHQSQG